MAAERPAYAPHLAACEIDLLVGAPWPLRPGHTLLMALIELGELGVVVPAVDGSSGWPLRHLGDCPADARPVLRDLDRLFAGCAEDAGGPVVSAGRFTAAFARRYEDGVLVHKGTPAGSPEAWLRAMVDAGLAAEGVLSIDLLEPVFPDDPPREGYVVTAQGALLAAYFGDQLARQRRRPNRLVRLFGRDRARDGSAPAGAAGWVDPAVALVARGEPPTDLFRPDDWFGKLEPDRPDEPDEPDRPDRKDGG